MNLVFTIASNLMIVSLSTFDNVLNFLDQNKMTWLVCQLTMFGMTWVRKLSNTIGLKMEEYG